MGKNLFTFDALKCTNAGAPRAVPSSYSGVAINGNGFISRDSFVGYQSGIINVVNDFQWTTSPPTQGRQEVPRIELRERRLKTNAIIAAAAYYLISASGSAGRFGSRLGAALEGSSFGRAIDALFSNVGSTGSSSFLGNLGVGGTGAFENSIISTASRLFTGRSISDIFSSRIEGLGDPLLEPYEGLYITEDTKFKYIFPYFNDMQAMVQNSFEVNNEMFNENTVLGRAVTQVRNATESLARLASFTEPGLYIERPKFYAFKSDGDSISFSFPLINTGWATYDDVRLNWQLAFLLGYQNRPNRKTREIIDPSVIYEVAIPGVKYMPYAYMSSLRVDYVGARRQLNLDVPTQSGNKKISTIVPDAYIISITLNGLVADSQNFLAAVLDGKQDVVSVLQYNDFNPFTKMKESFESGLGGST